MAERRESGTANRGAASQGANSQGITGRGAASQGANSQGTTTQRETTPHAGERVTAGDTSVAAAEGRRTFGWRAGVALGVVVLVVVYAIAELTAAVAPLRDLVEHQPIAIAVLVVGTCAVLLSLLPRPDHL